MERRLGAPARRATAAWTQDASDRQAPAAVCDGAPVGDTPVRDERTAQLNHERRAARRLRAARLCYLAAQPAERVVPRARSSTEGNPAAFSVEDSAQPGGGRLPAVGSRCPGGFRLGAQRSRSPCVRCTRVRGTPVAHRPASTGATRRAASPGVYPDRDLARAQTMLVPTSIASRSVTLRTTTGWCPSAPARRSRVAARR